MNDISVLVVDDSPTMRKMVMAALAPLDATFGEATNGLEALEQLALSHYDLMVLDMNMPDMHGLEVLAHTRALEQYQDMPILVLTTRNDAETRQAAVDAGANHYQTKPFAPPTLLNVVQELLEQRSPRA